MFNTSEVIEYIKEHPEYTKINIDILDDEDMNPEDAIKVLELSYIFNDKNNWRINGSLFKNTLILF